jgi:phosphatidate cytidylyltransferase
MKTPTIPMLAKRTISAIIFFIIGLALIFSGGWVYTIGVSLILSFAIWEFIHLFKGYDPNPYPVLIGTFGVMVSTYLDYPIITSLSYTISIFAILTLAIQNYEKQESTTAFNVTFALASLLFVTFLGSFIIKIRFLPNGFFWIVLSIFPVGIGDIGAYAIGTYYGKHKLAPKLSPKKTIEGYIGGVLSAVVGSVVIGAISHHFVPSITIKYAVLIGSLTGLLAPFGDLSKSIFKRHFHAKDTGNLIPGHGGMLDRIDTWLWASPIAYYLITFLFL